MTTITLPALLLAAGLALAPALAQAQSSAAPVAGSKAIPGEGPGGSGAGESTAGVGKEPQGGAPGAMGTMLKKPVTKPAGSAMGGSQMNGATTN